MTAREQIERAIRNSTPISGFVKIYDILTDTDIPAGEFADALREMDDDGWMVIPNAHGGDVTAEERQYCPFLGWRQVHLIGRI